MKCEFPYFTEPRLWRDYVGINRSIDSFVGE